MTQTGAGDAGPGGKAGMKKAGRGLPLCALSPWLSHRSYGTGYGHLAFKGRKNKVYIKNWVIFFME
jgi:hypothetical protein